MAVEVASLQFSTNTINSHESAKAFIERLIAQFNGAKWKRFIPELCPAITGRSSFLEEEEQVDQIWNCPRQMRYEPRNRKSMGKNPEAEANETIKKIACK